EVHPSGGGGGTGKPVKKLASGSTGTMPGSMGSGGSPTSVGRPTTSPGPSRAAIPRTPDVPPSSARSWASGTNTGAAVDWIRGWELTPTCAYETPATTSSGSAAGADTSISRPVAAVSMEKLSGAVATWAWAGTGCTAAR